MDILIDTERTFWVRRARGDDSQGILDCLRQAFAPYQRSYTPDAFADAVLTLEALQTRMSEMQLLVAVDAYNRVIGTIAYRASNGQGHLRGMAVRPEKQWCGVAIALLVRAESDLLSLRCRSVTLNTTRPLSRAMHLYERTGFRRTGEIGSFFGMELVKYRKQL